jgi:predicted RNA binding protein YcfA (HicA-like mRNA interferase family)
MSRRDKQLKRLCRTPPVPDLTWRELTSVLGQLGYRLLNGKGSRRKFHNAELDLLIICHEPHPQLHVDKGCIRDVVEHLKHNGLVEDDDNGHS